MESKIDYQIITTTLEKTQFLNSLTLLRNITKVIQEPEKRNSTPDIWLGVTPLPIYHINKNPGGGKNGRKKRI